MERIKPLQLKLFVPALSVSIASKMTSSNGQNSSIKEQFFAEKSA